MFGYYNNGFNNQPFQNKRYVVLKKAHIYVAVEDQFNFIANGGNHDNYQDFVSQGFIFWMETLAINSSGAIAQAKEAESQELYNLRAEIEKLKLESINKNSNPDTDPLIVLGFKENQNPSDEELKKRWKTLSSALHPDKAGSDFLMKIVNKAYKTLKP